MRCLVTGLESGCTRIVSKLIAINLGIISDVDEWDAVDFIQNDNDLVCHRSLPHGVEDDFITMDFVLSFDLVIISSRDWNCSLISKINNHEHDPKKAIGQQLYGLETMKNIILNHSMCYIFSPESAYLLQEAYTKKFLNSLGITETKHILFDNVNEKYLIGVSDDL